MTTSIFVGVPGSGKSLAMQDAVSLIAHEWPVFCIDSCFEWLEHDVDGNVNWRWRGTPPKIVRVPYFSNQEVLQDWALENAQQPGLFVFERTDNYEPHAIAALTGFIGDAYFVDDEIDKFATYEEWKLNPLREFLNRGRHTLNHEGRPCVVNIMGAMRRPQAVHTDLTNLCDEAFIFRCQGAATFKRLLTEGFIEPQHEERVRTQPNLHFVRWTSNGSIVKGKLLPPVVSQTQQSE